MMNKSIKIFAVSLASAAVLVITVFSSSMFWGKAPAVEISPSPIVSSSPSPTVTEDPGIAFDTGRKNGVYTILLVGNDDGNGNTDTIMLCQMDTLAHSMDFVSIPRDTLINENWNIRKINSVYWTDIYSGGNGIDALRGQLKRLTGFDVDCYGVIDLNVFVDIVDCMGGVYFDVPQALHYEDPWQDLYIHIEPGYQLLNGYDAMGVCRYRSGYIDGDIGRINMQHSFLKACAEQFTQLGKIPNLSKVIALLDENLDTNMSGANFTYFIRNALLCKNNIRFHTAPTIDANIHGYSYAVLDIYPWIDMINELLNPYEEAVSFENLDVVYKDGENYKSTAYILGADYYRPAPRPTVVPTPEPSAKAEYLPDVLLPLPSEVLPTPEYSPPTEEPISEMEIPGSIGNIIIDY